MLFQSAVHPKECGIEVTKVCVKQTNSAGSAALPSSEGFQFSQNTTRRFEMSGYRMSQPQIVQTCVASAHQFGQPHRPLNTLFKISLQAAKQRKALHSPGEGFVQLKNAKTNFAGFVALTGKHKGGSRIW